MDEEQLADYATFKQNAVQNPNVMAQIQALPPQEQEKLLQDMFRDYMGESEILNEQVAQADALRKTETPDGRQFGNVYVAANPLEHMAAGAKRYQGEGLYDKAMAAKEAMTADKTAAQSTIGGMVGQGDPRAEMIRKGILIPERPEQMRT